jgi:hypothetical protein
MNLDIAVFGLFFVKIDHVGDHVLQIDGLGLNVKMTGETQQLSGDGAATVHRIEYRIDVFHQIRVILVLLLDGEQVFHVTGGFIDQSQRIVDLMGHPGGQLPDGSQLTVSFRSDHGFRLLPVGLEYFVDHHRGGERDHHGDDDGTDAEKTS